MQKNMLFGLPDLEHSTVYFSIDADDNGVNDATSVAKSVLCLIYTSLLVLSGFFIFLLFPT